MKLTIGTKLGLVIAVTLLFMLAAIAANIGGLNTVRVSSARSVQQLEAAEAYEDLTTAQARSYSALFEYVVDGEAQDLATYQAARERSQQLTAPALEYCTGCHPSKAPDIAAILTALESQQASAVRLMDEALELYAGDPANTAAIGAKVEQADGVITGQLAVADQVQTSHEAFIDEQLALDARQANNLLITNITLGVLALLISGFLAIRVSGGIVRSIAGLRDAADGMSRGELETPIELKTGDEMEQLAASVERMRASLKAAMDRLRSRTSSA